jgi:phage/plasmid-associated DNA primase
MAGNGEMIAYLQRLVGYSLTGTTREQIFAFSYGDGMNGKGAFHHTIDRLLGDYAVTAAAACSSSPKATADTRRASRASRARGSSSARRCPRTSAFTSSCSRT